MVRIGIIGNGRMGKVHAEALEKLADRATVAGCVDTNPTTAQAFAARFKTRVYVSTSELVADSNVDAVVIATPTPTHAEIALAALKSGKHVFCEKPLARTLAQGKALLAAAQASKRVFSLGFVRRQSWGCQELRRLLQQGKIGTPRIVRVHLLLTVFKRQWGDWFADFAASGGATLDMLAHHYDLLNWYFGNVSRVSAEGWLMNRSFAEPMDYISGSLRFESGLIGHFECGWLRFGTGSDQLEIHGEKGLLRFEWGRPNAITFIAGDGSTEEIPRPAECADAFFVSQMQDFAASITDGRAPCAGIADGWASLQVCLGAIAAAEQGRVVSLADEVRKA
ncbi:MAG: hypothetical protein A3K19_10835 [Lentisphaerae bacterium RIFOXYB12_FULL_65_16]|nr:MAG: hypothetical protein A3K18_28560 [Lentisphaerae bacterium RIFOXYA12_64_32]OGV87882.1 MAG: hypothetical protein A3K19_10835 [Lentisphaerae bacterium RIFOXYB12_FULL_65_16]